MVTEEQAQLDLRLSIDDYHPQNLEIAKLIRSYGLESKTIFFIDLFDSKSEFQVWKGNIIGDRLKQFSTMD